MSKIKQVISYIIFVMAIIFSSFAFFSNPIKVSAESNDYLTFIATEEDSSVTPKFVSGTYKYSLDNGLNWVDGNIDGSTKIELGNIGDKVLLKGTNCITDGDNHFSMEGKISASGDITCLVNEAGGDVALTTNACFTKMFFGCESLVSAPSLPSTTLSQSCYQDMFSGCKNLKTAPTLSALTLKESCYQGMFLGCTSLTSAPTLPAQTMSIKCYRQMFSNCSSLTTAPTLPALALAQDCYYGMFQGCSKLTTTPELPATKLSQSCYHFMFNSCTSLNCVSLISATTLAPYCCYGMFGGCTNLKKAPKLLATSLAEACYQDMFSGCTSLMFSPALPATSLAKSCYRGMFISCISLLTSPDLPATNLAESCYQAMFMDCVSLTSVPSLPATTLATNCYYRMFENCYKLKVKEANGETPFFTAPNIDLTNYAYDMFKSTATNVVVESNKSYFYYNYLTFTSAKENSSVTIKFSSGTYKYSIDNGTNWVSGTNDGTTTINLANIGDKVLLKGTNCITNSDNHFSMTGKINASGDVTSLINEAGGPIALTTNSCFSYMFAGCESLISAPNLFSTSLTQSCYQDMFSGCVNLTLAPKLPAQTMAVRCYRQMFLNCSSLKETPELPALTLAQDCYFGMFKGCSKLTTTPKLPALTLARSCYQDMFYDCSNLLTVSELPATSLAIYCYAAMFMNCSSLKEAPTLPATALVDYCYMNMFYGCSGLQEAPTLPATTLAIYCYQGMFISCTSLQEAPTLPALALANGCYQDMFNSCTSLQEAPTLPALTLTESCYRGMFMCCSNLKNAPSLPATTLANNCYRQMFSYCSNLAACPALPATALADICYFGMFSYCNSIISTPELPALSLAESCYEIMFKSCKSLILVSNISATSLNNKSVCQMFIDCPKLDVSEAAGETAFFTVPNVELTNQVTEMFKGTVNNTTVTANKTYYFNVITKDPTSNTLTYNETDLSLLSNGTSLYGKINYVLGSNDVDAPISGYSESIPTGKNAGKYYVWYKNVVDFNEKLNSSPKCITITINKAKVAEPVVSGTYTYNGQSQNVSLTGVEKYMSTSDSLSFTNAGDYEITYTLDSNHTWNDGLDGKVSWKVLKADASIDTTNVVKNYTYTGKERTIDSGATLSHNETTLVYTNNKFTDVGIGKYNITISAIETANYNAVSTIVSIYVSKAKSQISVDQRTITKTYDETLLIPSATATFGVVSCDTESTDVLPLGENIITFTVNETANYYGDSKTVKVNVVKGNPFVKDYPIGKEYNYDGNEKVSVVIVTNPVEFGTMYYSVSDSNEVEPTQGWQDTIPTLKDAGTYYIWYKVIGDSNHNDISANYVLTTIHQKEIVIVWVNKSMDYTGEALKPVAVPDVLFGNDECEIVVSGEQIVVGEYIATAVGLSNSNYKLPDDVTTTYFINKADPIIDTTNVLKEYTYTGKEQVIDSGATSSNNETTLLYSNNKFTDVENGTYTITISSEETQNFNKASVSVEIKVNKAQAVISNYGIRGWTYGDESNTPEATTNFGTIDVTYALKDSNDFTHNVPINAGLYTVKFKVTDNDNVIGCEELVDLIISQKELNEPTVEGNYVYNKESQTVSLKGIVGFAMTTTDSLVQSAVGIYYITFNLNDNYKWASGSDGIVAWEIRSTRINVKEEGSSTTNVIIESPTGFSKNMTIKTSSTNESDVKNSELTVDYYNLFDESVKLAKNERVAYVVDIKILQEVDGNLVEVQPSDIKEGTTLKIKIHIPDDVDITNMVRILHVHSDYSIESIPFDKTKLDSKGYYEIEVDRLSEFAFIYEHKIVIPFVVYVITFFTIIGVIAILVIKGKSNKKKKTIEYALGETK